MNLISLSGMGGSIPSLTRLIFQLYFYIQTLKYLLGGKANIDRSFALYEPSEKQQVVWPRPVETPSS